MTDLSYLLELLEPSPMTNLLVQVPPFHGIQIGAEDGSRGNYLVTLATFAAYPDCHIGYQNYSECELDELIGYLLSSDCGGYEILAGKPSTVECRSDEV